MSQHEVETYFAAIRTNDLEQVKLMLDKNPSLANARMLGDGTLLNRQIWKNKVVVDIPTNELRDSPALHYATFHGHVSMVDLLLSYGADVDAFGYENNHEMTPAIVIAAWEGGYDILKLLLEHGADPNAVSGNGVTPLSTAIRHGNKDRVDLLRKFGAVR